MFHVSTKRHQEIYQAVKTNAVQMNDAEELTKKIGAKYCLAMSEIYSVSLAKMKRRELFFG